MKIINAFQTNGVLLTDEWCAFFPKHNFLIGLSLDGPRHLHDAYCVDMGGQPTLDRVMARLALLTNHMVDFNILCCVHSANARHPLQVYRFLRDEVGARFIQFIPIVEIEPDGHHPGRVLVSRRSVTGKQYGQSLVTVFDKWVKRDAGTVSVQVFDVALAARMGESPGLCVFEPTCGQAIAMEHDGDVYACDHFVDPVHRLGKLTQTPLVDLVGSPQQVRFGQGKRETLPHRCRACAVHFVCNGGCPKDRIPRPAGGGERLNYLCEGYKAFFSHIDRPMRLMSTLHRLGRGMADIMNL